MDRRGFLKAAGLGAGAAVMCRVPKAEAGVHTQVHDLVLDPKDILKDPTIGPVFDLNNDISGMACQFTAQLLHEHAEKYGLTDDEAIAILQWGLRQPAMIGILLAKRVVTMTFQDHKQAERICQHKVFKQMYTVYGELLDSNGPNVLGQYGRLVI